LRICSRIRWSLRGVFLGFNLNRPTTARRRKAAAMQFYGRIIRAVPLMLMLCVAPSPEAAAEIYAKA